MDPIAFGLQESKVDGVIGKVPAPWRVLIKRLKRGSRPHLSALTDRKAAQRVPTDLVLFSSVIGPALLPTVWLAVRVEFRFLCAGRIFTLFPRLCLLTIASALTK